jgi:methanogenic corrinoid protein MtbC1
MSSPAFHDPGDNPREPRAGVAADLVECQVAALPELVEQDGSSSRERGLQDANDHLAYLADAMNAGDPTLFASYLGWARVMLATRGILAENLSRHLAATRTIIAKLLEGATARLAVEYISAGLADLPSVARDLPTHLPRGAPHSKLARGYLGALLKGEWPIASRLILDSVQAGISVKDIYWHVFQPSQYEIGRLWQLNRITLAQERHCAAAMQLTMSQFYPHLFATGKGAGTLIATCLAGDGQEIGLRKVAEFFELEGWNTFYLGTSSPRQAMDETVIQCQAQVLAVSPTIAYPLHAVVDLIRKVRASPACQSVKILVGGYPFRLAPEFWRSADGSGRGSNVPQAIALASRLIAEGGGW